MRHEHSAASGRTIRVEGAFDAAALQRLQENVAAARTGERITVDLSKVRDMDDCIVAALAEIANGPGRVEFLGLRHHQLRLLRYFGVAQPAV